MQTLYIPPSSIKIVYPSNRIKNEECINSDKVCCTGRDENSRHPKVFISVKTDNIKCHYCGTIFRKQ